MGTGKDVSSCGRESSTMAKHFAYGGKAWRAILILL